MLLCKTYKKDNLYKYNLHKCYPFFQIFLVIYNNCSKILKYNGVKSNTGAKWYNVENL